jgi:Dolichyl-phosphate-mannose-protein mannosyltransferase
MSENAAPLRAGLAGRTALDRFLAAIPFVVAALVVLMILFWEAAVRKTPTIFTDELKWAQISRALAHSGHPEQRSEHASLGSLYAVLIAPAWWLHSTSAAYTAIKYLNVTVMAAAAVPVYYLARRLTSARAAAIAAIGTICAPALYYAPLLLPEVLAYPTFAACAYLCVRALAGDGRRWTIAAIAACVLAVSIRAELVCAGAALAIAAAALWVVGPRGQRLRRNWSLLDHLGAGVLLVGVGIVLNRLVSGHSTEWAVVTQSYQSRLWHLGLEAASALTIGLGILPVIAGLSSLWLSERRADPTWRAFAAFTAAAIVAFATYTGIKAAYLSTVFGTYVEERNLIYLTPLLLVGTVVYFSSRRPSRVLVVASTALAGWLVLAYGYQLGFPYFEAPGYGITAMANRWLVWDQPAIRRGLAVALVVAFAIAVVPFVARAARFRPAILAVAALGVAAWLLAGEVTSARGSQASAKQIVAHLPQPLDWIDQLDHGDGVTYLGQHVGTDYGINLTEFWNSSIDHVWTLDGTAPGPGPTLTPDLARPDGTLRFDPGTDYVVTDNGVQVIGDVLETKGSLSLVRIQHPWRLLDSYYGRDVDGWFGNDATYAYFGPAHSGTLRVDISRAGFCPTNGPTSPVTVRIGPVALNEQRAPIVTHPTLVKHFVLHSCSHVPIHVAVKAPVAVTVHVDKTVRLRDYGISDSREVGAQFGASFTTR